MFAEVVLFSLTFVVAQASAQEASLKFIWAFKNPPTQNSFQECEQVSLRVAALPNRGNFLGVPPYFLIAFEIGGSPTMANIGSDPSQLSWTVDHQRGANIMLTIVDSRNNSGGLVTTWFAISEGRNTACIPQPSGDAPSITTNVTNRLTMCDPWSILIEGGKKLYSLYLTALQLAPTVTIVKMGTNDASYTYINRAAPGMILSASVLDSSNQWGISSQLIRSVGSTDVGCGRLVPDPVTSSIPPLNPSRYFTSLDPTSTTDGLPSQTKQTWHISNKSTDITLIAGLSVSLGILTIFAFAALLLWWCRRVRKNSIGGTWDPRSDASTAPPPSSPPLSPPASASVSMHKVCHEATSIYTKESSTGATIGIELSSLQEHVRARQNGRANIGQHHNSLQSHGPQVSPSYEEDPCSMPPM